MKKTNKKNKETRRVIYVKYLDSVIFTHQAEYAEDHDFKLVKFDAVGFFIKETADAVYLSREVNTTFNNKRRAPIGIPKVAILERRFLTE